MPRLISSPTSIPVPGGKVIDEYVGSVNTQTDGISIARMRPPAGWEEPWQTPEFDEYTLVLNGSLGVEHDAGHTDVAAGRAILTAAGERVAIPRSPTASTSPSACRPSRPRARGARMPMR
jgi:hypothetical protein